VRRRLKLASVSPKLIKPYPDGEMRLDQLMAFTLSDDPDDHKAQEGAWFEQQPWWSYPAHQGRLC
jgi:ParB family chromosome partitioning protein